MRHNNWLESITLTPQGINRRPAECDATNPAYHYKLDRKRSYAIAARRKNYREFDISVSRLVYTQAEGDRLTWECQSDRQSLGYKMTMLSAKLHDLWFEIKRAWADTFNAKG